MGGSIARRLLYCGKRVRVCDINAEAVRNLVVHNLAVRTLADTVRADSAAGVAGSSVSAGASGDSGASALIVADTPAEVATHSQIVLVVVRDDEEVREVLCGTDGVFAGMATATPPIVLIHSTVQPSTVKEMDKVGRDLGIIVLDAPVTGGPVATEQGDLVVILGGDIEICAQVAPKLTSYAGLVERVGDVGAGQKAKIIRNLMTYSQWVVAAEAEKLAQATEVDTDQLWKIIDHSDRHIGTQGGYSGLRHLRGGMPGDASKDTRGDARRGLGSTPGGYPSDAPGDALDNRAAMEQLAGLAEKDVELAKQLAEQSQLNGWLPDNVLSRLREALGVSSREFKLGKS